MSKYRILTISHGHPDFSKGGAEIAAYNLYKAYKNLPEVEASWFLARHAEKEGSTGRLRLRREDEYLWSQSITDWHYLKTDQFESMFTWFKEFIELIKPNVVHLHHYAHIGIEIFRVIKKINPKIKIYLTIHEFMAICKHNGQMVKNNEKLSLCYKESADDCHRCFPEFSEEDFWLRKKYILNEFSQIDGFISPSEFLKTRYVEWGIEASKIEVIENGQENRKPLPKRELLPGEKRLRFGFFGQINPYKGLDILLEAIHGLPDQIKTEVRLEINGANIDQQESEFQQHISKLALPLIEEGIIQWNGPYEPAEKWGRFASIDWVVVPSVWWENSPMVIQEAFVAGRPVIASNIGGMEEKVMNGVGGLNFEAGSSSDLGNKLCKISADNGFWEIFRQKIKPASSYTECAARHIILIKE